MKKISAIAMLFCFLALYTLHAQQNYKNSGKGTERVNINFNLGWKFARLLQKPGFIEYPDNISSKVWSVISISPEKEGKNKKNVHCIIDGNFETRWYLPIKADEISASFPQSIVIDLSKNEDIAGFRLLPRKDASTNGTIKEYELYLSGDTAQWGAPALKGVLENSSAVQEVKFGAIKNARYLKFVIISSYAKDCILIAELGLIKPMDQTEKKKWEDQFSIIHLSKSAISELSIEEIDKVKKNEISLLKNKKWEDVNLPHTANIEPLTVVKAWQGICYYQKKFKMSASSKGKKVFVTFEGMMQVSNLWLNDKFIGSKAGGYLPLTIDLTDKLNYGKENTLLVRLDNQDNPLVPPGRPLSSLDFCYYGGIYRDVYLTITNPLHITDAVFANKVKSGGIYVTYPEVSEHRAAADIRTHFQNEGKTEQKIRLVQRLLDKNLNEVVSAGKECTIAAGADKQEQQNLEILKPLLWSPENPNLYTLVTSIFLDNIEIDRVETRIGIRKINFTRERGFEINGRQIYLTGANRHQEYPYIGNALSDNAQYRDIVKIKEAGFNIVRLAHYPQDPSVLDACDELGLLVYDCVPGWQFFNEDERFVKRAYQDEREMIRRDRNHPCIAIWETSLNEAYPPMWFRNKEHEIAKEETAGECFTGGDANKPGIPWDVPFAWYKELDNDFDRMQDKAPNAPGIAREYGDYEFGGESSTTRIFRRQGEEKLLNAAWNFQWEHNKLLKKWPALCGDAAWVMFDYNRGCHARIEASGLSDIFRIPKFSYYFFKSQIHAVTAKPYIYIANYWTKRNSPAKVVVYSNCSVVELYLNGKLISSRKPDDGPDTIYGDLLKGGNPFDGGNAGNLPCPPFTFTGINFEEGELKAMGKINEKKETEYIVRTPGKASAINIEPDLSGKPFKADGADAIFVYAKIVDKNGTVIPDYNNEIKFTVRGDAKIIGPSEIDAEAGIATILLQAGLKKGKITLIASSKEGFNKTVVIKEE